MLSLTGTAAEPLTAVETCAAGYGGYTTKRVLHSVDDGLTGGLFQSSSRLSSRDWFRGGKYGSGECQNSEEEEGDSGTHVWEWGWR